MEVTSIQESGMPMTSSQRPYPRSSFTRNESPPSALDSRKRSSPVTPRSALPSSTFIGMSPVLWNRTLVSRRLGMEAVYRRGLGRSMGTPLLRRKPRVDSWSSPSLGIARRKMSLLQFS